MPAISVDQVFLVGVAEIDDQHLGIVGLINSFHDALLDPDASRLFQLRARIWPTLVETFESHFATEQNFMAAIAYPGLASHTAKHEAFLERLGKMRDDATSGFLTLNSELLKTLSTWFLDHENVEDRDYAEFHRTA